MEKLNSFGKKKNAEEKKSLIEKDLFIQLLEIGLEILNILWKGLMD